MSVRYVRKPLTRNEGRGRSRRWSSMANARPTVEHGAAAHAGIELLRLAPPESVECDLLPPEAFPDVPPTERERRFFRSVPMDVDARDSPTVWHRLASSCSGWAEPPTPTEFYETVRASKPTRRQREIVRTWAAEAKTGEVIRAWVEGVYTWRQFVRALHRSNAAWNGYLNVMLNQLAGPEWHWESRLRTEPWFGQGHEDADAEPPAARG